MTLAGEGGGGEGGGGGIPYEVLEMRIVIEFQNSWIVVYYKIHFHVQLQPICAGKLSVVRVIDK